MIQAYDNIQKKATARNERAKRPYWASIRSLIGIFASPHSGRGVKIEFTSFAQYYSHQTRYFHYVHYKNDRDDDESIVAYDNQAV